MLPTKVCTFCELSETMHLDLFQFLHKNLSFHVLFCPHVFQGEIAPQFRKTVSFRKFIKHTNFCGKHISNCLFAKFLFTFTFCKFFGFHPPENESFAQKLIKISQFIITLMLFLQPYQVPGSHLL